MAEPSRSAFVEILHNIIDPPAANEAVLSQNPGQHLQNLRRSHPPALDQTYDHPQIAQHSRANPALKQIAPGSLTDVDRRRFNLVPLLVLDLLFALAFRRLVVLGAALVRTPPAVRVSAPKRTPEVLAASITGMCKEENMAMPTTGQTRPKTWLGPQHGPEHEIVLKHQIPNSVIAVPARSELKLLLDSYAQKPRVSDMILMLLCIASSYTIGTPCVER